ncbi:unnamed protein product, partial [Ectocarpus sp. 12 AP-2014]
MWVPTQTRRRGLVAKTTAWALYTIQPSHGRVCTVVQPLVTGIFSTLVSTIVGETHGRPCRINPRGSSIAISFRGTHKDLAVTAAEGGECSNTSSSYCNVETLPYEA